MELESLKACAGLTPPFLNKRDIAKDTTSGKTDGFCDIALRWPVAGGSTRGFNIDRHPLGMAQS